MINYFNNKFNSKKDYFIETDDEVLIKTLLNLNFK
jgi:hypothetical protein